MSARRRPRVGGVRSGWRGPRHVCILAETKGSSGGWDLRGNEALRKTCAEAWTKALAPAGDVEYHLVADYAELLDCLR